MLYIVPLAIVYFVVRAVTVKVKALYGQARERLGGVSARLQDNLGGFHLIKSFHTETSEEARFAGATTAYYDKTMEAVKVRTRIFPAVFFVGVTTNVIMLGLGAWLVFRREVPLRGLLAVPPVLGALHTPHPR